MKNNLDPFINTSLNHMSIRSRLVYDYTHASAIEKIESVHANGTSKGIRQILREIRADSRRGGHSSLQYI